MLWGGWEDGEGVRLGREGEREGSEMEGSEMEGSEMEGSEREGSERAHQNVLSLELLEGTFKTASRMFNLRFGIQWEAPSNGRLHPITCLPVEVAKGGGLLEVFSHS